MYRIHRDAGSPLYSDYVLYSPDVPVIRDEEGALLDEPWACSFLTSPAPYSLEYLADHPDGDAELESAFRSRIAKVLAVAAHHGHAELVLGAWGCGVFGGDAEMVARLFRDALEGDFRGVFAHVVFAVLDREPRRFTYRAFAEVLGASP